MAIDFKVPDLGENVDSGDIVNVMVKEGDEIQAEQSVMEIETGKAVVELPCPHAGRITKIYVQKGSKVKVGDPLLTVDGAGAAPAAKSKPTEAKAAPAPAAEKPAAESEESLASSTKQETEVAESPAAPRPKAKPAAKAAPAEKSSAEKSTSTKTPPAGPATRRLARELGVDLALVAGSGPHGRITEDDVKAAVREHASAGARRRLFWRRPCPKESTIRIPGDLCAGKR